MRLFERFVKWIFLSVGIMVALFVVSLVLMVKNDWISYKVDRLTLFNRLGVPEPEFQSVSRIHYSGAGVVVYAYRGVSDWRDNDEPEWKCCKLTNRGRFFVNSVQNVVSGEAWERRFPDKSIVTIFRTRENASVVFLVGEFMDIGGDLPNPAIEWRACVPDDAGDGDT